MTMGLVGEHAGEVRSNEQTGDSDVAAEELVAHRHHAHVVAAELVDEGREDPARRIPPSGSRSARLVAAGAQRCPRAARHAARGSPRQERRRPTRRTPARPPRRIDEAVHLELERARHADPVFVHREALVRIRLGERTIGEQVVLVGEERQSPPEHTEEHLLPPRTRSTTARASSAVCERSAARSTSGSRPAARCTTTRARGTDRARPRACDRARRRRSRPGTRRPGRAP